MFVQFSIVSRSTQYCSSVIIDENQLSSAHNILSTTKLKSKQPKQPPHNNRPKQLLLKASSYLSIGHMNGQTLALVDFNLYSTETTKIYP